MEFLTDLNQRTPIEVAVFPNQPEHVLAERFGLCSVNGTYYMPYIDGEDYLKELDKDGIEYVWVPY